LAVISMQGSRAIVLLGACAYQPGSFHDAQGHFAGTRITVDCLDLAIERRPDLRDGCKVVSYAFANRCDQPATVDLAAVRVVGRARDGADIALVPYDPKRELRPLVLDGRAAGREAIAYGGGTDVASVCIDAASITRANGSRWLCVEPGRQP
jgi:hypothetical protein